MGNLSQGVLFDGSEELRSTMHGATCAYAPPVSRRASARAKLARHRLKLGVMAGDLVAVSVAMAVAASYATFLPAEPASASGRLLRVGVLSIPVWIACLVHYRLYNARYVSSRLFEFRRVVHAAGASVMATAAGAYMAKEYVPRSWLVLSFALSVVTLTLWREIVRRALDWLRTGGRLQGPTAIIGANAEGREIARMLADTPAGRHHVIGFIDDDLPAGAVVDGLPVLGCVDRAAARLQEHGVENVVIATTSLGLRTSSRLAFELTSGGTHVELSTGLVDVAPERLTIARAGRVPVLYVEPVRLGGWRGIAKRTCDVVAAVIGLLLATPFLILAALAIRIESPGPVLFRQQRVGRDGRLFEILKLRSMVENAEDLVMGLRSHNEADGPLFKIHDDPRVTRVGRILRKLSIDEIPQLWNVVRGEMSLVGPRPALLRELEGWSPELHDRLAVRPGITGMWQVSGRANLSFEDYTRLDLYYVHNWSILTDIAMLAKTVPAVLSRRGSC